MADEDDSELAEEPAEEPTEEPAEDRVEEDGGEARTVRQWLSGAPLSRSYHRLLGLGLPALLCVLNAWRMRGHTVDDAYISFRYARNFARGWGLVYNAGERIEGYTNFLWTVLIGIAIRLGLEPIVTAKVLRRRVRRRHHLRRLCDLEPSPTADHRAVPVDLVAREHHGLRGLRGVRIGDDPLHTRSSRSARGGSSSKRPLEASQTRDLRSGRTGGSGGCRGRASSSRPRG